MFTDVDTFAIFQNDVAEFKKACLKKKTVHFYFDACITNNIFLNALKTSDIFVLFRTESASKGHNQMCFCFGPFC